MNPSQGVETTHIADLRQSVSMSVTPQHIENYEWQQALEDSERPLCADYLQQFSRRMDLARESGNQEAEELYSVLRDMASLSFDLDSEGSPFPSIGEVDDGDFQAFAAVFHEIEDPEFRARIGDILWLWDIGEHPHEFAFEAIDAYLSAAAELEGINKNTPTEKRIRRALSLARQLNRQDQVDWIEAGLEERIRDRTSAEERLRAKEYSAILYDYELGNPSQQGSHMEQLAEYFESRKEENGVTALRRSRNCWELAAQWYFRIEEQEAAQEARRRKAETFVEEAELRSGLYAGDLYARALDVYRGVPDTRDRRVDIRSLMQQSREKAVSSQEGGFETISEVPASPDDFSWESDEAVEFAKNAVQGKDLSDALVEIAFITQLPSRESLRERTLRLNESAPLMAMISASKHGSRGRKIAMKPSGTDDPEDALDYQIHQTARNHRLWDVVNLIEPARKKIVSEHSLGAEEVSSFLRDNPLVPAARQVAFTRGLVAGFEGDFITSVHILAVQMEESIRNLLRQRGVPTTYSVGELEREKNINTFFRDSYYREKLEELFGEATLFNLQSLLTESRGSNLRNKVAHALTSDAGFYQPSSVYYWWFVWHLIIYASPRLADWVVDPMDED